MFRRRDRWMISVALIVLLLLTAVGIGVGITIWVDPPVQYYGRWIRQHEIYALAKNSTFCIQLHFSDWYRRMAQIFPAPSSFICFNTDAEARRWMLVNKP